MLIVIAAAAANAFISVRAALATDNPTALEIAQGGLSAFVATGFTGYFLSLP